MINIPLDCSADRRRHHPCIFNPGNNDPPSKGLEDNTPPSYYPPSEITRQVSGRLSRPCLLPFLMCEELGWWEILRHKRILCLRIDAKIWQFLEETVTGMGIGSGINHDQACALKERKIPVENFMRTACL